MRVTRTPDDAFTQLMDYPFNPNYITIPDGYGGELRMHYVDEGPRDSETTILLLHGQPTWSYLYRHMIPILSKTARVIAPDNIGFGKSDKPIETQSYSYEAHVRWLTSLLFDSLDLINITLFCQDWGGLLGLRLVSSEPHRFARVVAANTVLPTGEPLPQSFKDWVEFCRSSPMDNIGAIVQAMSTRSLTKLEMQAYNAPFFSEESKCGMRVLPSLLPGSADAAGASDNLKAWKILKASSIPFLTLWADKDMSMRQLDVIFHKRLKKNCRNWNHCTFLDANHFIQEDVGPEIAIHILQFIKESPSSISNL